MGAVRRRLGWVRDLPDHRDYHLEHPKLEAAGAVPVTKGGPAPALVSLREWCSPVEDQGDLGSCTAHAVVGLLEYLQRRRHGRHIDLSRLFLYWAARRWLFGARLQELGDSGASIRAALAAAVAIGVPPERDWEYDPKRYNDTPGPWQFSLAQIFQGLHYVRLKSLAEVLALIRSGFPVAFGFSVYRSIDRVGPDGVVPFPAPGERLEGGHAVLAVGYDEARRLVEFRNSWRADWGDGGYGWLPYQYFEAGLCDDFWTLLGAEFVDLEEFR